MNIITTVQYKIAVSTDNGDTISFYGLFLITKIKEIVPGVHSESGLESSISVGPLFPETSLQSISPI